MKYPVNRIQLHLNKKSEQNRCEMQKYRAEGPKNKNIPQLTI